MSETGWREAIERPRLHREAIPRHVANAMAMEGEPVDEAWLRGRLARRNREQR